MLCAGKGMQLPSACPGDHTEVFCIKCIGCTDTSRQQGVLMDKCELALCAPIDEKGSAMSLPFLWLETLLHGVSGSWLLLH